MLTLTRPAGFQTSLQSTRFGSEISGQRPKWMDKLNAQGRTRVSQAEDTEEIGAMIEIKSNPTPSEVEILNKLKARALVGNTRSFHGSIKDLKELAGLDAVTSIEVGRMSN